MMYYPCKLQKAKEMEHMNLNKYIMLVLMTITFAEQLKTTIVFVDSNKRVRPIERFWDNTGLSPPVSGTAAVQYLGSFDQNINLSLIGSLPLRGITHVRIHWLLDLISIRSSDPNGTLKLDYRKLDMLLDLLHNYELKPGFELMGNPSGFFIDLATNATKIKIWKQLVTNVVRRYIERYGRQEVSQWHFETWNEPDLKMYNILNFTLAGYLKYVDACIEGVKDACRFKNTMCQIGGPAGVFKAEKNHPLCWGLLELCNNKSSCGIDYITFHKKGGGAPLQVVNETLQLYYEIQKKYPHLARVPIVNDEADILTGWWRQEDWRGDVRYAAAVCQVIISFMTEIKHSNIPLKLISNDNAFLNEYPAYFNQRTLLTRFQMNNTADKHSQFFKKPVYVAMAMLAHIGKQEIYTTVQPRDNRLSVFASLEEDPADSSVWMLSTVLVMSSNLEVNTTSTNLHLNIILPKTSGLQSCVAYCVYLLDNKLPHPADVWKKAGSPNFPSKPLRNLMRKTEGPYRIELGYSSSQNTLVEICLNVTVPSIALVQICSLSHSKPGRVVHLDAINITYNEVLLTWSDKYVNTRCIKTYEVQFCKSNCTHSGYKRVNLIDTVFLAFQFVPRGSETNNPGKEKTQGYYRVRAVDYWHRKGDFSEVFKYGGG